MSASSKIWQMLIGVYVSYSAISVYGNYVDGNLYTVDAAITVVIAVVLVLLNLLNSRTAPEEHTEAELLEQEITGVPVELNKKDVRLVVRMSIVGLQMDGKAETISNVKDDVNDQIRNTRTTLTDETREYLDSIIPEELLRYKETPEPSTDD